MHINIWVFIIHQKLYLLDEILFSPPIVYLEQFLTVSSSVIRKMFYVGSVEILSFRHILV